MALMKPALEVSRENGVKWGTHQSRFKKLTVEVRARENAKNAISSEQVIIQEIRKSKARIVQSLHNLECRPSETVQDVLNPSVHEDAHQVENQDVEIYESTTVNGTHEASVESLEGEWNEVRNPSKPIQEIDTLIVGDSAPSKISNPT